VWKLLIQVLIYETGIAVYLKVAYILVLVDELTSLVNRVKLNRFNRSAVDGCESCGFFGFDIQRWAKWDILMHTDTITPSAIQHILATKINACIEVHYLSTIAIQS